MTHIETIIQNAIHEAHTKNADATNAFQIIQTLELTKRLPKEINTQIIDEMVNSSLSPMSADISRKIKENVFMQILMNTKKWEDEGSASPELVLIRESEKGRRLDSLISNLSRNGTTVSALREIATLYKELYIEIAKSQIGEQTLIILLSYDNYYIDTDIVRAMIENGAANEPDPDESILFKSIRIGNLIIVDALLKYSNRNPNIESLERNTMTTPLLFAVKHLVESSLKENASRDSVNDSFQIFKAILGMNNFDVNKKASGYDNASPLGATLLMMSRRPTPPQDINRYEEVIDEFLKVRGIDLSIKDNNGKTPSEYAYHLAKEARIVHWDPSSVFLEKMGNKIRLAAANQLGTQAKISHSFAPSTSSSSAASDTINLKNNGPGKDIKK